LTFALCDIVGSGRLVVEAVSVSLEVLQRKLNGRYGWHPPGAIIWASGEPPERGALRPWKYDGEIKLVESELPLELPPYEETDDMTTDAPTDTTDDGWTDWMTQGDLADELGTRASAIWKAVNEGPGTYRDWELETRPVDEALDGHRDLYPQTSTLYRARLATADEGISDDGAEQTGEAAASSAGRAKMAQTIRDLKSELSAADARIEALEEQRDEVDDHAQRVAELEEALEESRGANERWKRQRNELRGKLDDTQDELREVRGRLEERIKGAHSTLTDISETLQSHPVTDYHTADDFPCELADQVEAVLDAAHDEIAGLQQLIRSQQDALETDEDAELTAQLSLIQHSAIQYVDAELRNRSDLPKMIVDVLDELEHVIEQQDEQIERLRTFHASYGDDGEFDDEHWMDSRTLARWLYGCMVEADPDTLDGPSTAGRQMRNSLARLIRAAWGVVTYQTGDRSSFQSALVELSRALRQWHTEDPEIPF
jgi:hypothetical protein